MVHRKSWKHGEASIHVKTLALLLNRGLQIPVMSYPYQTHIRIIQGIHIFGRLGLKPQPGIPIIPLHHSTGITIMSSTVLANCRYHTVNVMTSKLRSFIYSMYHRMVMTMTKFADEIWRQVKRNSRRSVSKLLRELITRLAFLWPIRLKDEDCEPAKPRKHLNHYLNSD